MPNLTCATTNTRADLGGDLIGTKMRAGFPRHLFSPSNLEMSAPASAGVELISDFGGTPEAKSLARLSRLLSADA